MRWCYVGKATKIFFLLVAVLAVAGVVLAFRAVLHRARSRSKSDAACAVADECQPILPEPATPATATTWPPPPPVSIPAPSIPAPPLVPPLPPAITSPPPALPSPPPPAVLPPPQPPALLPPPPAPEASSPTAS